MKKLLGGLDRAIGFVSLNLGGIYTAAAFLLVLFTVICRYVLHVNTGGIDEFTTYFVVCSVWVGAVLCSRDLNSGQIKIDLLASIIKNQTVMTVINIVWQIIAIAASAVYFKIAYDYFHYQLVKGSVLSGIRFPMAVFSGTMTVCVALITIYEVRRLVFMVRSLCKSSDKEDDK